jgi:putative GTP pyrophosphokinase
MEAGGASKRKINQSGALLRDLPPGVFEAVTVVEEWRRAHSDPLADVTADVRRRTPEVTQRLKRFDTIVNKLRRHPRMNLSQMEDIAGVRATLPTQEQVLHVAGAIESAPPGTLRRRRMYIDGGDPGPKADGYRAVHLVVVRDGLFVEIQLRTVRQDAWAQAIEDDADRLRMGLKFGAGPEDLRDLHRMTSEYFAMLDAGLAPSHRFVEQLSERYAATRRHFKDAP